MITQKRLHELLSYNPENGLFVWREYSAYRKGLKVAGTLSRGHVKLTLDGKQYLAHRLVWLYLYGYFPAEIVDHINGIKCDNRIANLRLVNAVQSSCNTSIRSHNKSGVKGVYWEKRRKHWVGQIVLNKKKVFNCSGSDLNEVEKLMINARKKYHGEYASFR